MPASQFNVPGPAQVAVGAGANKSMLFLGYTQQGVRVREELFTSNVQADYAGTAGMPADMLFAGKMIVLTMQLVRFVPSAMLALKARYFGGAVGGIEAGGIGTLAIQQDMLFPVMVRNPYATKAAFSLNEPGVRALHCFLSGAPDWDVSTKEQVYNLSFTGLTVVDPFTLAGTCWDIDMTTFPTPV